MAFKIPLVELGSLLVPTPSENELAKQSFGAEQLTAAFEEFGLCYLRLDDFENGYATKITESALAASKAFFSLPQQVKDSITCDKRISGTARGYLNVGSESGGEFFERKEAFSYSCNLRRKGKRPSNPLEAENVWPSDADGTTEVRKALDWYYVQAGEITLAVAKALELAHGARDKLPEDFLSSMIRVGDSISLMRCFYYHERQAGRNEYGSVQHTDWGFCTLIAQELHSEPALQVFHNGTWVYVPPMANTLVINAGDFVALLSRDPHSGWTRRLQSPLHRVVLTTSSRNSLVFFQYPAFDAELPKPGLGTEGLSLLQNQSGGIERNTAAIDPFGDLSFGECIVRKWEQVKRSKQEEREEEIERKASEENPT